MFTNIDTIKKALRTIVPNEKEYEKALYELTHWEEQSKKQRSNQELPPEELIALPDGELYAAVWNRTDEKVEQAVTDREGVAALPRAAQAFCVAYYYEMEMENGGLCQYFVNSSRELAPLLPAALDEIGAADHKTLFDAFVRDNGIDVNDLSSFISDDVEGYLAQTERYPFDDFDNAFYALKPIQEYLIPYIRAHIPEF